MDLPNASISTRNWYDDIKKEGEGCSDKKSTESYWTKSLIRKALYFVNIDDKLPVQSIYYLLTKRTN